MRARPASSRRFAQERPRLQSHREAGSLEQRLARSRPAGPRPIAGHGRLGLPPAGQRDLVRRRQCLPHRRDPVPDGWVVVALQPSLDTRGPSRDTPRRRAVTRWSPARRRPRRARRPSRRTSAVRSARRRAAPAAGARAPRRRRPRRPARPSRPSGRRAPTPRSRDHGPAPFHRAAGVGDVAAPQRERRGSQVVAARPAAARAGRRTRARSDPAAAPPARPPRSRSRRPRAGRCPCRKTTPTGSHASARRAQPARLRPATEQDQRFGHVAGQEVAVDGLEAGPLRILDARDTRRRPPPPAAPTRSSTVVRLARDAEQGVRVVDLARRPLGLAQQLDRGVRVAAPGERDAERRRRVDLLVTGYRLAGAGDLDRLASEALRIREDPVEHSQLGERGDDRRPLGARVAGDEVDGPLARRHRAPAGSPAARRTWASRS